MKKFYLLGLAAAALVAGVYVQGCGGSGGSDGGSGPFTACTSDANCPTGQICNTAGGVCMTKCSQASDCPDTEKNCDKLATTSDKVCQCQTDALCGGSNYCNSVDKICEVKCSDNSGCTGYNTARTCTSSQCMPGATTDGGTDGGAATCDAAHPCDANSYCGTTGTCIANNQGAGPNCQASEVETQGAECAYGQACFNDASFSSLPVCETANGQCATSFQTNTTANASPVIFDVAGASPVTDPTGGANCNTGQVVLFTGHYYDPQNDVPTGTTSATYGNIYYVTSSNVPGGGTGGNTYYHTAINTDGTFTFYLCTDLSGAAAGVYITDSAGNLSNSACISL